MKSAVNEALDHLEKQAVKYKTRWRSKKRHDLKKWNGKAAQQDSLPTAIGLATPKTATSGVKIVTTDDVVQPLFLVTKGAPSASVTRLIETVTKVAK